MKREGDSRPKRRFAVVTIFFHHHCMISNEYVNSQPKSIMLAICTCVSNYFFDDLGAALALIRVVTAPI
jgi:hypothetical protein